MSTAEEISHGDPLQEEQVRSFEIAPMIVEQVERWRTARGLAPQQMRILDYGCGRGRTMFRLRDRGYDAYGVDVDARPVENGRVLARARGLEAEQVLTVLDAEGRTVYPDDFFEFTTSFQVFEHVQDIDRAARELARITKPGGGGLHVFPPVFYPLEGHLMMPFVHWLPKQSRARYWLIRAWVALGVEAKLKAYEGLDPQQRAERFHRFSVENTRYWTCGRTVRAFRDAGLTTRLVSIESPNVVRRLEPLLGVPGARSALNWGLSRFASIHLLYAKPERAARAAA
jgi:SAM-dependent methyltransferase